MWLVRWALAIFAVVIFILVGLHVIGTGLGHPTELEWIAFGLAATVLALILPEPTSGPPFLVRRR